MKNVLVTGGASGLGWSLIGALKKVGLNAVPFDIKAGAEFDILEPGKGIDYVRRGLMQTNHHQRIDILINCAGINGGAWLEDMNNLKWDSIMDTNAKGIMMMTQALLPDLIDGKGTVLNIVSNASHMPMTCSLAYNASKAAAHIMTLQLSRELGKKHGITVFGISPNKLSGTEMSRKIEEQTCDLRGWTPEFAREYQRNALPAGEETNPHTLAEFIAFLLSTPQRHKYLQGCVLPYGA